MEFPSGARGFRVEDDAAWHTERDGGVGGSQVAELLGVHAFASDRPNPAVLEAGHLLEPRILARVSTILGWHRYETGICLRHPEEPWRRGTLDAVVLDAEGSPVLVAEIKAVFRGQARRWWDGVPDHVLLQALWYQDLTQLPVLVVKMESNAWALGNDDPDLLAAKSGLEFYHLDLAEQAERRQLIVEGVRAARAGRLAATFAPAPASPPPPQGTYSDAVLVARWEAARERYAETGVTARAARTARAAALAEVEALAQELRERVGAGQSLVAGGRLVSVNDKGTLRVRETT